MQGQILLILRGLQVPLGNISAVLAPADLYLAQRCAVAGW